VNSGKAEERYYIKQGNTNVIFDTGWWETSGTAYNGDKDQFVVEYSPGENTTYQFSSLDSDSDGIDDNASFHQNDRGSYVENRWGESVITNQAVAGETNLTVVVESRSLFQASAIFDAALSKDVLEVPTGEGLVKISPSLFSTLYDVSVDTFENAIAATDKVIHEIDVLASSRGQLGVRMNELQNSAERLSLALSAEAKHLNRMEGDIAENVISNAKSRILMDSNSALLVHARGMNRELMNTLL
jgi:flagellin-like hook-associated protein FlgL